MRKFIPFVVLGLLLSCMAATAQSKKKPETKKSNTQSTKERHKKFWTKVGKDQRDFWKGEHEQHVKNKKAKKGR